MRIKLPQDLDLLPPLGLDDIGCVDTSGLSIK